MQLTATESTTTGGQLTPEELGLTGKAAGGNLCKNEFLELLTKQLQYQDPLSPMDNTAMIAQLAQFSTLEQMENLNTTVETGRRESGLLLAGALTGRQVNLVLSDKSQVNGTVEGARWTSNGICLDIGGSSYALSAVEDLVLTPAAEAQVSTNE